MYLISEAFISEKSSQHSQNFASCRMIKCFQYKAYVNSQVCGISHAAIYDMLMGLTFSVS
jgi:hypothetical protein